MIRMDPRASAGLAFRKASSARRSWKTPFLWSCETLTARSIWWAGIDNHVGQGDLGFEDNATIATFLYSYHKEFFRAKGLRWYAGVGPSIIFIKNSDNIFALRPHLGLDFKVDGVPFVINFDWRPSVVLSDVGDNEVGAFGFGLQFAIN